MFRLLRILFSIMVLLAFYPSQYYRPEFTIIGYFLWAIGFVYLIKYHYKPSLFIIFLSFYQIWMFATTCYRNSIDLHMLFSSMRIIIFFAMAEFVARYDTKNFVKIIFWGTFVFIFIDILSIYLYPNGLRHTGAFDLNEYIEQQKVWILGVKNNRVYWYLIVLISAYLIYYFDKSRKNKMFLVLYSLITLLTFIKIDADTSFVVFLISCSSIYLSSKIKKVSSKSMKRAFIIYFIIVFLIITGSLTSLASFVGNLFGKDATFSGRTIIWGMVLAEIMNNPVWGSGIISSEEAIDLMGNYAFVNSHNQWLQTLWQGGLILLLVFVCFFYYGIKKITRQFIDVKLKFTFAVFIFALFVEMTMEVIFTNYSCWTIMLLIYSVDQFNKEKNDRLTRERKVYGR